MNCEIQTILDGGGTKADKVRALVAMGVSKPEIATLLHITANHVYTVIARDRAARRTVVARPTTPNEGDFVQMIAIDPNGCLVLPPEALEMMELTGADQLVMLGAPGELRLLTRERAAKQLQEAIREASPANAALARTLLADIGE